MFPCMIFMVFAFYESIHEKPELSRKHIQLDFCATMGIPPVSLTEIELTIKKLKVGKSVADGFMAELQKSLSDPISWKLFGVKPRQLGVCQLACFLPSFHFSINVADIPKYGAIMRLFLFFA